MNVKVTDRLTPDGRRFMQQIKELSELEVRIGFQQGEAQEEDGTDICDVAAWNELGTANIPSRPFLRKSVDENEQVINDFLKDEMAMLKNGTPAEQILKEIGIFQKGLIQEKILDGDYVPNAASTIRKKGSAQPLIDTGRMRQSVNYVIKKKGE